MSISSIDYLLPPSFAHLKVLCCLCFASTLSHNRSKFDLRSSSCVFLGYLFGVKGYKLLDLTTKRLFVSRDVHFLETAFPFISPSHSFSPHTNIHLSHLFPSIAQPPASLFDFSTSDGTSGTPTYASHDPISDNISTHDVPSDLIPPLDSFHTESSVSASADLLDENSIDSNPSQSIQPVLPSIIPTNLSQSSIPLRKSSRISKPPAYLTDFQCSTVVNANLPPLSANKSGTPFPLSKYLNSSKLSSNYAHFCSLIFAIPEPTSYHEAVKNHNWQDAMASEIASLEANQTWTITPLPLHKRAIGCK